MVEKELTQCQTSFQQRPIKKQLAQTYIIFLGCFSTGCLAIVTAYLISQRFAVPLSHLTRDLTAIAETEFYIGLLSSLGIALWSATAGICLFGASILVRHPHHQHDARFFLCSGLICVVLALDDAFLLHEEMFPIYLQVPEKVVYLAYFLLICGYLLYFYDHFLKTDYVLLIIAFTFLGASLVTDALLPFGDLETFIEDNLKFFGILFWLGYFARAASTTLRMHLRCAERRPARNVSHQ